MKLYTKIIFIVFSVMAITGLIGGGLLIYFQRSNTREHFHEFALSIAGVIRNSLEHDMLTRNISNIQETISQIGKEPFIRSVVILNSQGQVAASSNPEEIGSKMDNSQLQEVIATANSLLERENEKGTYQLSILLPVINKPACHRCHNPGLNVIDVVKVGINNAPLNEQLKQQALIITSAALVGFLSVSLTLGIIFRKGIVNRFLKLKDMTTIVASRDFSMKSGEKGKDEIAQLGYYFDDMVHKLDQHTRELHISQARLAVILDKIPQGVFTLDSEGKIEYANLSVSREMNRLQGDLLNMEVNSFITQEYLPVFIEKWENMKKERTQFSLELDYTTGRGKAEPGLIFVAPIFGPDSSFSGAVLLGVNLSQVKEKEKKREQEERLAFLGLMASKMSHELRNPLGVMTNSIYLLKKNNKNDENIKKHLDVLEQQVDSSTRLISSIMDFARPRELVLNTVNLNRELQNALERVAILQGVEVEQNLTADLPEIQGDSQQLMQVFINLITNAYQAMPQGGKLVLKTSATDNLVVAEVQDTGTGIDPEFMKKIFQPFHSSKARGMGLGLSIIKDTVERHGGKIEVQSRVGVGTTFSVYLPVKNGKLSGDSKALRGA